PCTPSPPCAPPRRRCGHGSPRRRSSLPCSTARSASSSGATNRGRRCSRPSSRRSTASVGRSSSLDDTEIGAHTSSTSPDAEDGHEEITRPDPFPCACRRARVRPELGRGRRSPPSWIPRGRCLRGSPGFSAPPLLSSALLLRLWLCRSLRSVRRRRSPRRRVQFPRGRLYVTTRRVRAARRLRPAASRVLLLARTRAGPATNANCDPIPSRKVRAPRRRDDDALYVGVDPQPSAAASAARYPACRAADRADAAADPRPTLLVD